MAHGGPKVQEPSLLQLTGARCSIIYNSLSSKGYCLQHPTLLPGSCCTAQDQLPRQWVRSSAAGQHGCGCRTARLLQLFPRSSQTPLWKWARATQANKVKGGKISPTASTRAKPKCHFGTTWLTQPKHCMFILLTHRFKFAPQPHLLSPWIQ